MTASNHLVVCQRCARRWHRLCLDLTEEELRSPTSLVNQQRWLCGPCVDVTAKRRGELAAMSKNELCALLQGLYDQHPEALASAIDFARESVQPCSLVEMIAWIFTHQSGSTAVAAAASASTMLSLSEIVARLVDEFGIPSADANDIFAAVDDLQTKADPAILGFDNAVGKYFLI